MTLLRQQQSLGPLRQCHNRGGILSSDVGSGALSGRKPQALTWYHSQKHMESPGRKSATQKSSLLHAQRDDNSTAH
ncbi:uncharacterized protein BYT42DRAFT_561997 [Radiomyces spectabilis]|uniref:uncharacterized protein n=1 Tax=Radiomyces spectabilis TaxID=64574 RepID=UPI002221227E|nr:uncharacterized protein BYT42DRAFT_561997 [Radiomyces spectabilis]KAI8384282.1 hypothetical protein BYT42DRAFT_561997 [Radiomyces spectabilis]